MDVRGTGTTRTTFGEQPLATRQSAPSFGFGTASREVASKVFVSQQHTTLATAGKGSPGPHAPYAVPASIGGKHPDGRRRDAPSYGFGSSKRGGNIRDPGIPGPAAYNT